jgi:hypothetical protein
VTKDDCCCEEMWNAVNGRNKIPINLDENELPCGIEFVDVDLYLGFFGSEREYLKTFPYQDMVEFCPFCGKKIYVIKRHRSGRWVEKTLCGGFLAWFNKDEVKAPTRMFEYDHRNNQFYLHNRRGFGEGFTPVKYCIYCGEPLSEMIEKHGLPNLIKNCLHTDEWWKKRGL